MILLRNRDFYAEFAFSAVRSSGAGGQNVNKVNTKVELRFSIQQSKLLTENEKTLILQKLENRINSECELVLSCQTERSQIRNREKVVEKFYYLLEKALTVHKRRVATEPSRASKLKRLETKRIVSVKKRNRRVDL